MFNTNTLLANLQEHSITGRITSRTNSAFTLIVKELTDENRSWLIWIIHINGLAIYDGPYSDLQGERFVLKERFKIPESH